MNPSGEASNPPAPRLSPREADCARMLARGHNYESAGAELGIGQRTVRFHVENAKRKLKARTACELVALAIKSREIEA